MKYTAEVIDYTTGTYRVYDTETGKTAAAWQVRGSNAQSLPRPIDRPDDGTNQWLDDAVADALSMFTEPAQSSEQATLALAEAMNRNAAALEFQNMMMD